eukprot:7383153-Prymnesium_polylepis.2
MPTPVDVPWGVAPWTPPKATSWPPTQTVPALDAIRSLEVTARASLDSFERSTSIIGGRRSVDPPHGCTSGSMRVAR